MLICILLSWAVSIVFLYIFFKLSPDMQELMFLGSLGAPMMLPLVTIVMTILYFLKG